MSTEHAKRWSSTDNPVTGDDWNADHVDGNGNALPTYSYDSNGDVVGLVGPASSPIAFCVRDFPLRVATFGDSTANTGTAQSPDSGDCTVYTAPFPGSGSTALGLDPTRWQINSFYPQGYLVFNGGISGQTTAQMLARDNNAVAAARRAITDVIGAKPDVVILRGGSINDLIAAVADATVYSQHTQIIQRLLTGNVIVIDEGFYGYSGVSGTPAAIRTSLLSLNAQFATFAATYPGRVYFLNCANFLSDAAGNYLTNISYDGTHPGLWGNYLISRAEGALLTQIFGPSSGDRYPGVNFLDAAASQSLLTNPTGGLGAGFTVARNNGNFSVPITTIETINGRTYQVGTFTINATGGLGHISAPYVPQSMGLVAGDIYGIEAYYFIAGADNLSAPPTPNSLAFNADNTKTAAGRYIVGCFAPNTYNAVSGPMFGKLVIPPMLFQEPSGNISSVSNLQLQFGSSDSSGTVRIGLSEVRIVKLSPDTIFIRPPGRKFATNATASPTYTVLAGDVTGAETVELITTNAGACEFTLRSAAQMLADTPGSYVGYTWKLRITQTGAGTLTMTADGGATVTLVGATQTVPQNTWREWDCVFTSATAATFTSTGTGTYS